MTNDSFGLSFSLIGQVAKIMICLVHQIGFESLKSRSIAFCDEQKCHSTGTPAPVTFFVFFFHMQMWTKAPFLAPMRGEYEELWRPAVVVQGHGDRERSVVHYKGIVPILHNKENIGTAIMCTAEGLSMSEMSE